MHAAIKKSCCKKVQIFLFLAISFTFTLLSNPALGHTTPEQPSAYSLAHIVTAPQLQSVVVSVSDLATGKLLVANRRLRDPNFSESVILLLEYSKDGAMGVIINRPTDIDLATVFSKVKELKKRKDLLYLGGPVGGNQVLLLACTTKGPKDSKQVLSDVYLVSSQISLQQLVGQGDASLKLRAYAGYAGGRRTTRRRGVARRLASSGHRRHSRVRYAGGSTVARTHPS